MERLLVHPLGHCRFLGTLGIRQPLLFLCWRRMNLDDLIHYLRLGGATLGFILIASIVAVAVALERVVTLWGIRTQARTLTEEVSRQLLRGDITAARATLDRSSTPLAEVFRAAFERTRITAGSTFTAVDRQRNFVLLRLRNRLWILGTIGATTPFVGLFGTVVGIMRSFRDLGIDVEGGGSGGSAAVMTGISEALVVTAAGIIVAVEAVVLYNYFQARLARIAVEFRLYAEDFVELLAEAAHKPARSESTPTEREDA